MTDSLGIYQLTTPTQTELKSKPFTALRERFSLFKDYSSTARAAKDTSSTPKLSRHFKIERNIPSDGSYCNSTVSTSIQELGCPEYFENEHLDMADEREEIGLDTTLYERDSQTRKVEDFKEITCEKAKYCGER